MKSWVPSPTLSIPGTQTRACSARHQKVETGGSKIQGHPQLCGEFKAAWTSGDFVSKEKGINRSRVLCYVGALLFSAAGKEQRVVFTSVASGRFGRWVMGTSRLHCALMRPWSHKQSVLDLRCHQAAMTVLHFHSPNFFVLLFCSIGLLPAQNI